MPKGIQLELSIFSFTTSQHPQPVLCFTWEALYADYLKMERSKQTKPSPKCCVLLLFFSFFPHLSHKNGSLVLSVFIV